MPEHQCSLAALRLALNHLYEPKALQSSPLIQALGVAGRPNALTILQQTLTQAIESLKPDLGSATPSLAWRAYEILYYRYVQQCSQQEVADQLGMSVRHLKREQRRALEALAHRLGERYHLPIGLGPAEGVDAPEEVAEPSPVGGDLRWLKEAPPGKPVDLHETVPAVLELIRPMAVQHRVDLQLGGLKAAPPLAVHSVALRQILLSLLSVAIRQASGGRVTISARKLQWEIHVLICGAPLAPGRSLPARDAAGIATARRLLETCGGSLDLSLSEKAFAATLALPAAAQVPVLIVDDNLDALCLLQRYATGTRYRVVGEPNPDRALQAAAELLPQAIVLDVMMPEVDGWEILGRLRQHPLTSHVPVIACTILAQEELALSLGVSAFLQKPIAREAFLRALDRVVAEAQP